VDGGEGGGDGGPAGALEGEEATGLGRRFGRRAAVAHRPGELDLQDPIPAPAGAPSAAPRRRVEGEDPASEAAGAHARKVEVARAPARNAGVVNRRQGIVVAVENRLQATTRTRRCRRAPPRPSTPPYP